MKRLVAILAIICLGAMVAPAVGAEKGIFQVPFNLSLTSDKGATGTTTVLTGNSYFYLSGSAKRINSPYTMQTDNMYGAFTVQLIEPSGVTRSSAHARVGYGTVASGTSFSLFYQVSSVDTDAAWSGASIYYFMDDKAMSGVTTRQIIIDDIDWTPYIRWGFRSEATQFGTANFMLHAW